MLTWLTESVGLKDAASIPRSFTLFPRLEPGFKSTTHFEQVAVFFTLVPCAPASRHALAIRLTFVHRSGLQYTLGISISNKVELHYAAEFGLIIFNAARVTDEGDLHAMRYLEYLHWS